MKLVDEYRVLNVLLFVSIDCHGRWVDEDYSTSLVEVMEKRNSNCVNSDPSPPKKRRRLCLHCNQFLAKTTYWEHQKLHCSNVKASIPTKILILSWKLLWTRPLARLLAL